jgi:hypothetical protein
LRALLVQRRQSAFQLGNLSRNVICACDRKSPPRFTSWGATSQNNHQPCEGTVTLILRASQLGCAGRNVCKFRRLKHFLENRERLCRPLWLKPFQCTASLTDICRRACVSGVSQMRKTHVL